MDTTECQSCVLCYEGRICEHFPEVCPLCTIEDYGTYYTQCLYCTLSGNLEDLYYDWDSYDEVIGQGHDAFDTGYQDGLQDKKYPDTKGCEFPNMVRIYDDGYQAGKNKRLFTKYEDKIFVNVVCEN